MQERRRLGCISGTAIIATALTLAVIVVLALAQGGVMFNPGELNAQPGETLGGVNSHAALASECSRCHPAFWATSRMSDLCVECHVGISAQISGITGLHGAMLQKNQNIQCQECHPEHRGAQAPLTEMTSEDFPHEMLGYSLEGHAQRSDGQDFTCADCHADDITVFEAGACEDCHRQIDPVYTQSHLLWVGSGCLSCHDGVDTYGSGFSHVTTGYPLTGKHNEALCSACHLDARTSDDLKNTPRECSACHLKDDVHEGRFGQDCGLCHTPDGWKPATFDHDRSNFPLTGAHIGVACEQCHVNGAFKGTATACSACHADPAFHAGAFSTDCASCHSTSSWLPASFNLSHPEPRAEEGGTGVNHGRTTCRTCHPATVREFTCLKCHSDNQGGEGGDD